MNKAKKLTAIILSMVLILSVLPAASAAQNTWADNVTEVTPVGNVYTVNTPDELAWIAQQVNSGANNFKDKTVKLGADLDLKKYIWAPIGSDYNGFCGTFDGQNKTISGLIVAGGHDYVGLFGYVGNLAGDGGTVTKVRLKEPRVSGVTYVGAVAGFLDGGEISYCEVENGTVSGRNLVGGLVGVVDRGHLTRSYFRWNTPATPEMASVSGFDFVGGVVGEIAGGMVDICYNNGQIKATAIYAWVGGVAGHNGGKLENCYNQGTVTWTNAKASTLTSVGGVVGSNAGSLKNCYHAGTISAAGTTPGGVVGAHKKGGSITGCYYDETLSGVSQGVGRGTSAGVFGKTTTEMKAQATFAGWEFSSMWGINEGTTYPYLKLVQGTYLTATSGLLGVKKGKTIDLMQYIRTDAQYLKFTSLAPNIATVSQNGVVTGVVSGTGKILVNTIDGSNLAYSFTINVSN